MWMTNKVWMDILCRAHTGDCSAEDINSIQQLVLTDSECELPDFENPPWDDTILITPWNSVRTYWNEAASIKHSRHSGNIEYSFYAEDTVHQKQLSVAEHFTVALLPFDDTDRLPTQLTICPQMKVMVMKNICTHAGLANGTRGTIAQVVLDERELCFKTLNVQGCITLMFPPTMLLLKPTIFVIPDIQGIPKGLIPMFPDQGSFKINTSSRTTIHQCQFTLTPAYAFTDFKSHSPLDSDHAGRCPLHNVDIHFEQT
jgi:hypothetical protein